MPSALARRGTSRFPRGPPLACIGSGRSGTQKCTTSGHTEGEIASNALEGTLGVERITINKEGKEVPHIGLDLYPVGKAGPLFGRPLVRVQPGPLAIHLGAVPVSSRVHAHEAVGREASASLGPRRRRNSSRRLLG
jgi:hypothetical protein